jgi:hypothetical protein
MQRIVMYATGISIYLKSFVIYKLVIFGTYHPDTLHLTEQGTVYPWPLFKAKCGT